MSGGAPLTVVVITRNEERVLGRCLESVAWADELLVVDSGSTDRTLEIAARHGARTLCRPWRGYAEQKNFGADQARHDWVLNLDADEWLPEAAGREVRAVLADPRADGFAFRRRASFCGAFLDHAWTPDRQIRLYRRERGRFAGGRVHASVRLRPGARLGRLREPILHLAYRSLHDYVERLNRYTDLTAEELAAAGRRLPWARLALSPPATFLKQYVWKLGFLDGVRGLVVSAGSAFYVLLKYAKLWERSRASVPRPHEVAGRAARGGHPPPAE